MRNEWRKVIRNLVIRDQEEGKWYLLMKNSRVGAGNRAPRCGMGDQRRGLFVLGTIRIERNE